MASKRIKVQKSEPPESTVVLAAAIVKISEAARDLKRSGLNERAIIVLLHDYTKLPKKTIKTVLDALPRLNGWYCR